MTILLVILILVIAAAGGFLGTLFEIGAWLVLLLVLAGAAIGVAIWSWIKSLLNRSRT